NRGWVAGANPVKKTSEQPAQRKTAQHANYRASDGKLHPLAEDEGHQISRRRPERHSYTEFVASLISGIGNYAVGSNRRKRQREQREQADEEQSKARR